MLDDLLKKFHKQKSTAHKRDIPWKLDFQQWLKIWKDSGQLHNRGNRKDKWVMARNMDQGAYEVGNVQIIRFQDNCHDGGLNPRIRKKPRTSAQRLLQMRLTVLRHREEQK